MADMSFLPEDYVERRIQARTNLICLSLFVIVLGGVVAAYFVTNQKGREVQVQEQQVNADFADAAKRLEQLDELQARKAEMVRKAEVAAVLVERVPRSLILSEIVNAMPRSVSLTSMSLDTRRIRRVVRAPTALEQAKKNSLLRKAAGGEPQPIDSQVSMELVGLAPTDVEVAQFMAALGVCRLFKDVNLVYSEQAAVDKQEVRRFRVDLQVQQDVDLRHFKPTLVRRASERVGPGAEMPSPMPTQAPPRPVLGGAEIRAAHD